MRLARLKARRDFLRVAGTHKRFAAPGLVLQVRSHEGDEITALEPIRIGFTVSRKVGGAVVRNRVRRRLRAAALQVMAARAKPGRDYVVVGRKEAVSRPFDALLADLDTALAKTGSHT